MRAALVGEPAQRLEQRLDRLRRQHRRRLVHDEEVRVLQQAADDLDALALADRHRVHVPAGIERQPVPGRHVADARRQVGPGARGVEREGDVLGDRQRLEQREVLEHHADAELARLRRVGHRHRPAVPEDRAGVGLADAVDDLHQRRLAGAVLAQHRVDLAGLHAEVDAVVGDDRRIDLGDAGEPQPRHRGRRRVAGAYWTTFVLRTPVFALGAARRAHARCSFAAWKPARPSAASAGIRTARGIGVAAARARLAPRQQLRGDRDGDDAGLLAREPRRRADRADDARHGVGRNGRARRAGGRTARASTPSRSARGSAQSSRASAASTRSKSSAWLCVRTTT